MSHPDQDVASAEKVTPDQKLLFYACFMALIATAFGFVVRGQVQGEWAAEFGLSQTEIGRIGGVGLWPFAISIVLFSLIIDRIGYGVAMGFAFGTHIIAATTLVFSKQISQATGISPFWCLYFGTLVQALGNGTVEAVINPVVATLFSRDKTKWLNILHAGWPGGLVIGGILAIFLSGQSWQVRIGLVYIPVVLYGLLTIGRKFPVSERVAAGVSYNDMLKEVGLIGAGLVSFLIVREVGTVFGIPEIAQYVVIALVALTFGGVTKSLGNPLFIFLLIIMMPLAITELGTDGWITDLMGPEAAAMKVNAGWFLVYTSVIMMILRFFAGPIVHRFSPLGLLAISALLAIIGLVALSKTTGNMLLVAATLYGFGKTFFWPTMLGVVAEQFPKGGALTLNAISGLGMLAVGIVGTPLLGNIQDKAIETKIVAQGPNIETALLGEPKTSLFGTYRPVDPVKEKAIVDSKDPNVAVQKGILETVRAESKKDALMTVALFPCFMLACYLSLILFFKSKGGYKPKELVKIADPGDLS